MNRPARERAILEIIASHPVGTQDELARELARRGVAVTQATVSRDVKRLRLVKVAGADGGYRYAVNGVTGGPHASAGENLRSAFRDFVTGLDSGEAFFVVKTLPGRANAVGIAIDEARRPDVAGTIAGDDTILVIVRKLSDRERSRQEFEKLLA
ncbi:MAG TPA: arginine repressor [Thermoanaerobaculia bacterium]|nr:arginine repressor [Thermoanaerobaculia bacterium]